MITNFLKALLFINKTKLYTVPLVIFTAIFLILLRNREITVYPGISTDKIIPYNDSTTNGNSLIEFFRVDSAGATLQSKLRNGILYPYAGFKVIVKKDSLFKDLSGYDQVVLDLSPKEPQDIEVVFHNNIPGYTDQNRVLTYRFLAKTFAFQKSDKRLIVPLKSFVTPAWWFYDKNFTEDSLAKDKYKEVAEIIFQNGFKNSINKSYCFTLKHLSLRKDIRKSALWFVIASIGWLIFYSFFYLFFKNMKKPDPKNAETKMVISYEQLDVSNDSDDCLNRIVVYIAKEYKNSKLTVNQIAREVGVSPVKVTQILKDKKNCSYKQYLNAIRLAEAKRLLIETDRNIVDISLKVGYNNVTHFYRIFKEVEGISPRQFRLSGSKPDNN